MALRKFDLKLHELCIDARSFTSFLRFLLKIDMKEAARMARGSQEYITLIFLCFIK
jgi:hypothetical protein